MHRTEAVAFLKELKDTCNEMTPDSLSIDDSDAQDSVGYKVLIKGTIDEFHKERVKLTAKKSNLAVKEYGDVIIIYKQR